MNDKFLKPYNPAETESRIYKLWEESGFFAPEAHPSVASAKADNPENLPIAESSKLKAKSFSMVMPPPNVTGVLHMGHALMLTLEDIMVRFARMQGKKTLWVPGTDHAAIATQAVVEKEIYKKEGKNRHDLGREEFLKRVETFAAQSHKTITSQIRVMGASCDWSREAFTLDEKRTEAVRSMFKMMYDDGLIYRGHRIVNWDPKGQTTISDDEIVYREEKTVFYYFTYGPFTIGTSRPETKFGDKYVVMHPDDTRYAEYTDGQKIELEWINGPITATVVKDTAIDMEFGSGVMTITPWHDTADFEIAERHKLDKEQIIDERGKLLPIAGEFAGLKIADAREKVVEKLRAKGLVVKEEPYTHNLATAERTGGTIEPQIKLQWFVDVNKPVKARGGKTLKELMREPVAGGKIKIIPEHFEKTYFHWIDNLRDWCISRQIWYGHRIPVWYKKHGIDTEQEHGTNTEMFVGIEPPQGDGWEQDPDTLDTWFSSGLWTFSTLGWPSSAETATAGKPGPESDLANFHPTDVLETGYEILFFWVARMILMSQYALGVIPFKTVYLHGTVRDAKGRKMSKSLGNGIDPIDIAQKFGADAARMTLIVGNTPGTDMRISEEKIRGYKHFANKLWNIARFILENTSSSPSHLLRGGIEGGEDDAIVHGDEKKLLDEQQNLLEEVTRDMEEYRFYLAAEKLYHYTWHTLADRILEESKTVLKNGTPEEKKRRMQFLLHTLDTLLKALHPFIPFVTEEIWGLMGNKELLMVQEWPVATNS
ncbi:MAG: valine--tRNA ligase [bacterium]|nr:valine--tRNA ligase [bacterium]